MTNIFELVKDPYERKARVIPGLLVALPLLVPLLCVYGAKHPVLTGVIGLLGGCGAIYALASVARGQPSDFVNSPVPTSSSYSKRILHTDSIAIC